MDEKDLEWVCQVWRSIHALYEDTPGTESYAHKRLISLLVQQMARVEMAEFLAYHRGERGRYGAPGQDCVLCGNEDKNTDPRHSWSLADWEAEAWKSIGRKGEDI